MKASPSPNTKDIFLTSGKRHFQVKNFEPALEKKTGESFELEVIALHRSLGIHPDVQREGVGKM